MSKPDTPHTAAPHTGTPMADSYQPPALPPADTAADQAIIGRHSIRAFKTDPVPLVLVQRIIEVSARAPSGTNTQPWRVDVCAGPVRDELVARVSTAHDAKQPADEPEYPYYPSPLAEPWLARRREVGWALYGLLGIERHDMVRRHQQHGRNFCLFDAPVGLFFSLHRDLQLGSWLDCGMFMQNIMISARGHGLDTCPQAAWTNYHSIVKPLLGIPDDHILVSGMALGHIDAGAIANRLVSRRVPLAEYATFQGFDET